MLNTANKFLSPIIERNNNIAEFKTLSQKEKVEIIKNRYNLTHGKGNRKKKKK